MSRIVGLVNIDGGCHFHRVLQPARFLSVEPEFAGRIIAGQHPEMRDDDHILYHGMLLHSALEWAGKQLHKGKKFIWSMDDDFLSVPDWNPCKPSDEQLWGYYFAKGVASHILTSTDHLAGTFNRMGMNNVWVAPNLFDLNLFDKTTEPRKYNASIPLTILWAGSPTHRKDVALLEPVIDAILDKYGRRKVEFAFLGDYPPDGLVTRWMNRGVTHMPPLHRLADYHEALQVIRPNIVLAPLVDCEFNKSKSNIRVLESWSLSAPVVASNVGEYRCVRNGIDGFVCETADDWVGAIEVLINNPGTMQAMGSAGRKRVGEEYDWNNSQCREPWRQFFRTVLA